MREVALTRRIEEAKSLMRRLSNDSHVDAGEWWAVNSDLTRLQVQLRVFGMECGNPSARTHSCLIA